MLRVTEAEKKNFGNKNGQPLENGLWVERSEAGGQTVASWLIIYLHIFPWFQGNKN